MTREEIKKEIEKITLITINTKDLPLALEGIREIGPISGVKYHNNGWYIDLINTKIENNRMFWPDADDTAWRFTVTLWDELWDEDPGSFIDTQAKVPSNADLETKIKLRIAFRIWYQYNMEIFNSYIKIVNPSEYSQRTVAASREWYKTF